MAQCAATRDPNRGICSNGHRSPSLHAPAKAETRFMSDRTHPPPSCGPWRTVARTAASPRYDAGRGRRASRQVRSCLRTRNRRSSGAGYRSQRCGASYRGRAPDRHCRACSRRSPPTLAHWSVGRSGHAAIRPDGPHDAVSSTWWRELAADVGLAQRAVQRILRQVTGAAETLIARATGEDGLPATLQRDVRRVIRRRARDLADPR